MEDRRQRKGQNEFIKFLILPILVAFCILGATAMGDGKPSSGPKRLDNAAPGDCAACHGDQKVLSPGHVDTKGMMMEGCAECHTKEKQSLWSKITLGHLHALHGIGCSDCHHDLSKAGYLSSDECLACHGSFEEVAALTKDLERNPHNSPHYGIRVDCDLCHLVHRKSENMCGQCHSWTLTVP